nr:transport membrane protein [Acorus tatarinowii]
MLEEVRIRGVRILIGICLTWFTRYWFPEESIYPLASPLLLTMPLDSSFVCTQSTEAFYTYVATSSIACSYFVFPFISHQIWCFFIPSCYREQRRKYAPHLYFFGFCFFFFFLTSFAWVVPNVWHFLYNVGQNTNLLMIKLQPKIYDYIMLTIRILFISLVCSIIPVIVSKLRLCSKLRVMVFSLFTAALTTPPDIWCQIVASFPIFLIIEFAIYVALILKVREEREFLLLAD